MSENMVCPMHDMCQSKLLDLICTVKRGYDEHEIVFKGDSKGPGLIEDVRTTKETNKRLEKIANSGNKLIWGIYINSFVFILLGILKDLLQK
jgi:hypothetical protein